MSNALYRPYPDTVAIATAIAETVAQETFEENSIRSYLATDFVTTATTFVEVFDTTRNVEANTKYSFEGEFDQSGSTAIDCWLSFALPTGASISWSTSYQIDGITPVTSGAAVGDAPNKDVNCIELVGATGVRVAKFSGKISIGSTTGEVAVLACGKTGGALTCRTGSFFELKKLVAS